MFILVNVLTRWKLINIEFTMKIKNNDYCNNKSVWVLTPNTEIQKLCVIYSILEQCFSQLREKWELLNDNKQTKLTYYYKTEF